MRFTAAGDTAIQRVLTEYDGIDTVRNFINQGDVRFFNLETTVNKDCFANFFSGGTWLRTDRKVLESTKILNFNMTTAANNHCMDYGYEGLLQTIKNIDDAGYIQAGCGRNLREAASPRYLDLPNGRVALIACSTHFAPGGLAGEQSRLLPGRPGINGLRVKTTLVIENEDLEAIKRIAAKTGINVEKESGIKSGYSHPIPEGEYYLGSMNFETGDKPGIKYEIEKADMTRIEKAVEEAAFFADYVLVSLHCHDRQFEDETLPAKYIEDFAHHCIDCGAHAIIGHGPHLLRPFEVYKERPIFYSLGDFLLQLENCELAPEEFYAKFGMTSDNTMYELFKVRTRDFTCGLQRQSEMMESVLTYFEMEDGKLKSLEFIPLELGIGMNHSKIGLPRLAKDNSILERLAKLSAPYGTKLEIGDRNAKLILK